jgi:hypothetical protein
MDEIQNYVPPKPPTFATEIGRTFAGSVAGLNGFARATVLFFVALAPWLVLLVPAALLIARVARRPRRQPAGRTVSPRNEDVTPPAG